MSRVPAIQQKSRSRMVLESAGRSVLEQLEGRQLLSGVTQLDFGTIHWGGQSIDVDLGRYIGQAKPGKSFEAIAAKQGFTNLKSLGGGVYAFDSAMDVSLLEKWGKSRKSNLEFLRPSGQVTRAAAAPNDPFFGAQWSLNNTGQLDVDTSIVPTPTFGDEAQTGTAGVDIGLLSAWDIEDGTPGTGESPLIVAVLDTGTDLTHPDLIDSIYINPGEVADDGIDNDGNGYIDDVNGYDTTSESGDVQDTDGHGSHTAGIIAATSGNGIGISGIVKGAKILTVKVFPDFQGSTSEEFIIAGVNYVADFATRTASVAVMNLSLGGLNPTINPVYVAAFDRAAAAGVVATVSAGNDSADVDQERFVRPARFSEFSSSIITVAATDNRDQLASFSNFGKNSVAVGAPGVNILSTVPIDSDTENPSSLFFDGLSDGYTVYSGTSEAAPTVAGIVALLRAYRPTATPEQVVEAIKQGVDVVPSLNGNGLNRDKVVSTGGRVNAEKALRALVNNVVDASDSVTRGNWKQPNGTIVYGRDGAFVVGNSTVFPSFVTGTFTGNTATTVSSLRGSRALSAPLIDAEGDFSTRSPTLTTAADSTVAFPSFSLRLQLAADTTRRVSLYMADLARKTKQQTVTVTDNVTGAVLDSVSVSNIINGQYLTLDLNGDVTITFTGTTKALPVLNAVFFDTTPGALGVFTGEDRSTRGKWIDVYGADGDVRFGIGQVLPSYATVTTGQTATSTVLKSNSSNRTALEDLDLAVNRGNEAFLTGPGVVEFTTALTGTSERVISLYMADYNRRNRVQRVDVLDPNSGALLDTRVVRNFRDGVYLSYTTSTSLTFRITNLAGDSPVVSGVFFDSTLRGSPAVYSGTDSASRGDWRGNYGSTAAYIAGATTQPSIPGFGNDVLNGQGGFTTVLNRSTRDRTWLQDPNSNTNRVSAIVQNSNTITLDLPFDAGETNVVTLYLVDVPTVNRDKRVTSITVTDDTSGETATKVVRDFAKGKYVSFTVTGPVTVTLQRLEGASVQYSGLFIN